MLAVERPAQFRSLRWRAVGDGDGDGDGGDAADGETTGAVIDGRIERVIDPPLDNPLRFAGRTYVLVGRGSYSSAVLFANVMQDFGFATLAGSGGAARTRQSGRV